MISDSAVSCPPHRPQCRIRKPYFFQNLKCISYHADDPLISVNYVYLSWRVKYRKCRALADRQVVMEMSSRILWRVDPPFPSLQSTVCLWPRPGMHARLFTPTHPACWWGLLGPPAAGLAVWMPWPSSPTLGQPSVPPTFCSPLLFSLRFQFQWRLMVARLCLILFVHTA